MEFTTPAQRAAYERVAEWIARLYGESAFVNPDDPSFGVPVGAIQVAVAVQPMGDDEACVDVWTWPAGDAKAPDQLLRHLLETSAKYRFGDLNLQADGTLLFERIERMDALTKDSFESLLYMMSSAAVDIADDLKQRLG